MLQRSTSVIAKSQPTFAQGLTSEEARQRLVTLGPNEPMPVLRAALVRQFLLFLTNPLVLILHLASVISAVLGDMVNASIIALFVLMSVTLNIVRITRSLRTAKRMRAQIAPTIAVMRDGTWQELLRSEIVPGDLIRLGAGDLVSADARLFSAHNLPVQQAVLAGE
jgi:Mg2+-importing ATPase